MSMVYRHAPGINTSSKDPTSLVSAEAIPVLYLITLVGTWGNISLVYLVPVSYQSQYQTCLLPVKNQSWAQHQHQTVCVFFSFFEAQHQTWLAKPLAPPSQAQWRASRNFTCTPLRLSPGPFVIPGSQKVL
jgi:heme A synthase